MANKDEYKLSVDKDLMSYYNVMKLVKYHKNSYVIFTT